MSFALASGTVTPLLRPIYPLFARCLNPEGIMLADLGLSLGQSVNVS